MAKLIYSAITSLDSYVADEDGNFDWAVPDEEVLAFVNDLERQVGAYGRRLYEVMVAWESMDLTDQPPFIRDFAEIWQAADKVRLKLELLDERGFRNGMVTSTTAPGGEQKATLTGRRARGLFSRRCPQPGVMLWQQLRQIPGEAFAKAPEDVRRPSRWTPSVAIW